MCVAGSTRSWTDRLPLCRSGLSKISIGVRLRLGRARCGRERLPRGAACALGSPCAHPPPQPELSPVDWVTLGAHYSVSGQPAYAYHAFYMAQLESSGVVDRATAASIVGQINERRVLADE